MGVTHASRSVPPSEQQPELLDDANGEAWVRYGCAVQAQRSSGVVERCDLILDESRVFVVPASNCEVV